jgi:hypothetical protein
VPLKFLFLFFLQWNYGGSPKLKVLFWSVEFLTFGPHILYINSLVCPSVCPTRHSLRGNRTRTGTATAVRSGNLQADASAASWLPQQAPAVVFVWTFASLWSSAFFLYLRWTWSPSVRPSVRPVTLCVVTGPEPEPLLQFVPEISCSQSFQDVGSQFWDLDFTQGASQWPLATGTH